MLRHIIVEGVDRIGKSTLIEGLYQKLGYFQELHYQKPQLLDRYVEQARGEYVMEENLEPLIKRAALKAYQVASFIQMFHALESKGRFLMNRSHLGEYVYAPRYRWYDGSYVFDLERQFRLLSGTSFANTTLLVLVYTSDLSFITEDGQSLGGLDKREGEQADFKIAFERSIIKHKVMIDVCDGEGKFKPKPEVLNTAIEAWQREQ